MFSAITAITAWLKFWRQCTRSFQSFRSAQRCCCEDMAVAHTYKNSIRPWIQLEPYCLAVSGIRFYDLLRHLRHSTTLRPDFPGLESLPWSPVCLWFLHWRQRTPFAVWRLASSGTKNCMDICVEFAHLRPWFPGRSSSDPWRSGNSSRKWRRCSRWERQDPAI